MAGSLYVKEETQKEKGRFASAKAALEILDQLVSAFAAAASPKTASPDAVLPVDA
jgi:hypothetical protein